MYEDVEAVVSTVDPEQAFLADVLAGLGERQKRLPARWLYDDAGSALFEAITALPEYYPTRTEREILHRHGPAIAAFCGPFVALVEYGAGSGLKTELLLAALPAPRLYVPVDIAADFLSVTAERIRARFPALKVAAVVADFTRPFALPLEARVGPRAVFFPGSTLGNLDPAEAHTLLLQMRHHVGAGGKAVIGVDLVKPIPTLIAAYDDAQGVTAAFNRNYLVRINRELGADFDLDAFRHEARWNAEVSAVEMHLVSQRDQLVTVAGRTFFWAAGETLHTESSRKYTAAQLGQMAEAAGWRLAEHWTDPAARFAVVGLQATGG